MASDGIVDGALFVSVSLEQCDMDCCKCTFRCCDTAPSYGLAIELHVLSITHTCCTVKGYLKTTFLLGEFGTGPD